MRLSMWEWQLECILLGKLRGETAKVWDSIPSYSGPYEAKVWNYLDLCDVGTRRLLHPDSQNLLKTYSEWQTGDCKWDLSRFLRCGDCNNTNQKGAGESQNYERELSLSQSGVMWPQAKDFKQPLEGRAEKKKDRFFLEASRRSTAQSTSWFILSWVKIIFDFALRKWDGQMNCEALISYSRPRKPIHKYR